MFTLKVRCRSREVVVRMDLPRAQPALLMRTVGGPSLERTASQALVIEAGEARSQWK